MSRSTPPGPGTTGIASPCISVCTVHPDGSYCVGCFRTLDEIADWSRYSDAERRRVLALVEARRAARRDERRARRRARDRLRSPGT